MSNRSWRVGNVPITQLVENIAPIGPAEFLPLATPENMARHDAWLRPHHLDADGNLVLSIHALLVESGGRKIVVDTCVGNRSLPGEYAGIAGGATFLDAFRDAGFAPETVDLVICTHLHFDHVGWNTIDQDGRRVPCFPNARHLIQRKEWDYWTENDERRRFALFNMLHAPLVEAGLLDLVEGEYAVTSEMVTVPTPGHTPGHVGFVVASGGERAYILGDSSHHPAQVTYPDWYCGADVDPAESSRVRKALMDRMEAENALIAAGHFPFPGIGRAKRVNGRRVFQPIS